MKNIPVYILIIIFCSESCRQPNKNHKQLTYKQYLDSITANSPDTSEYIDWHKSKINGFVHTVSFTKFLYYTMGKPDNISGIINLTGYFPDRNFKIAYINGSQFELYGDTTVLKILNFRNSDVKLITQNLILDRNTTLTSLAKSFPHIYNNKYGVNDNNEKLIGVEIRTTKPEGITVDGSLRTWILLFKDGKLVEIDYKN